MTHSNVTVVLEVALIFKLGLEPPFFKIKTYRYSEILIGLLFFCSNLKTNNLFGNSNLSIIITLNVLSYYRNNNLNVNNFF